MPVFTPPDKQYQGYIFDCDGTLANSMPVHYRAWAQATGEYGGQMREDLFYELGGVPTREIVKILNEKYGTNMDPETVATRKEAIYIESIGSIQPIPEVAAFARRVAAFARVAVASGGYLPVVTRTLAAIGFKDFFAAIVTSEQVKRGKPSPDLFLEAAARLGVAPRDCLVLEDSVAGFQAATAAGMEYAVVGRPQT
jgi:HAD superfamily hydrolase (TIGR01509 family)